MTESVAFTDSDLVRFFGEYVDIDRQALVRRLAAASQRLAELGEGVPDETDRPGTGWSAKEILAHIAGLSKLFGVVGYQIGAGKLTRIPLTDQLATRDLFIEQMQAQPARELVALARSNHERTLDWLSRASPADLLRRCDVGGGASISAEETIRLALCAHLEQHLDQLETVLKET